MNNLNCEYIREIYPDVLNRSADANTVATVRGHLAQCDECRAEAEVLQIVHGARVEVPAGLHDRVISRLNATTTSRFPRTRHLAFAATVAAAIIGGAILFDTDQRPATPSTEGLGFVTVEDAMVSGTSSLQDLTVEELEQLLGEIES
jgi:hypothetical protein